ncbi:stage III sporulation protein AF, partial [Enterocloster bolteae]
MEAVYGWVKNIIYYMIFLSVVNNLLADSKYGKYIRFFSGMVLILLVVSPFTGGLHLDEQISSMFKSISFQNDTDDLKQDLWGMEERRLDQVIREYEQAVAADVEAMARAEGLECTGASVQIDGDRNSSRYGQIEGIGLVISGKKADTELGSWDYMGSRPVNVDAGRI